MTLPLPAIVHCWPAPPLVQCSTVTADPLDAAVGTLKHRPAASVPASTFMASGGSKTVMVCDV